jgi:hypothetical protein
MVEWVTTDRLAKAPFASLGCLGRFDSYRKCFAMTGVRRGRLLQSFLSELLRNDGFEELWGHKGEISKSSVRFARVLQSFLSEVLRNDGFEGLWGHKGEISKSSVRFARVLQSFLSELLRNDGFEGLWGNNRQIASVVPIGTPSQ